MCGVVGYIGTKKASPILIDGLMKLEYRGYDSSGISTVEDGNISLMKDKGRVKNLYDLSGINDLEGTVGIAHTRWATHGKPSKENSHPHMDNSNTFSVVHNGIIENYSELREFLTKKGYTFYSQTDTEVIPNLIHFYYSDNTSSDDEATKILQAMKSACMEFKGSYAIELICINCPNNLFVVRQDSPLVIGKTDSEFYLSSDIPAILNYTRDFYLLEDLEFTVLTSTEAKFFDKNLVAIPKELTRVDWDITAAEKGGYEDFMLKEIYEQPTAIKDTLKSNFNELDFTKEYLRSLNHIYIVACGTAMHAGLVGKTILEKLCGIPVTVDVASEFRYRDPLVNEKSLCIFTSQSGETADTIAALKLSNEKGAKTISVSNVIGSSITREATHSIYTIAGPEISVASTKAYTSQVVLLSMLAIHFAEIMGNSNSSIEKLRDDLVLLPSKIEETLKCADEIKTFANLIYKEKDLFFIGRGVDDAASKEGALKLKELTYIHADSYPAGELKHGSIALIEDDITVIGTITEETLIEKTISNLQEVITRGAKVLVVTNQNIDEKMFDKVVRIPTINTLLSPVLSVIPLQFLSYYVAKAKELDVDKPRNLAKSVTVE